MFAMVGMGSYQTHNLFSGPETWNYNPIYWADNGDGTFTANDASAGNHNLYKTFTDKTVNGLVYTIQAYLVSKTLGQIQQCNVKGVSGGAMATAGTMYKYDVTAGTTDTDHGYRTNGSALALIISELSLKLKR